MARSSSWRIQRLKSKTFINQQNQGLLLVQQLDILQFVVNVIKDGPAENGDTVVIDFEGFVDGVPFEGGKAENYQLELGSKAFIPGFEDQLIGAKSEQDVEVNVTFPKDYHASLAGKAALFKVKVHEVKGKEYPELTDELVKELEIENVNTVEEYQNYVKEDLKKRKSVAAENHLVTGLVDAVCKNSYADFPESLIKSEVEHQVNNVEMQAKQYGMPVEMLLQYSDVEKRESGEIVEVKNL